VGELGSMILRYIYVVIFFLMCIICPLEIKASLILVRLNKRESTLCALTKLKLCGPRCYRVCEFWVNLVTFIIKQLLLPK
jgi:hypothetical protein